MSEHDPDTKVITHVGAGIDGPDDPSFPFKLEANLRPLSFMEFLFRLLHGPNEIIVLRGTSRTTINRQIRKLNLRRHPRLQRFTVSGPEGPLETVDRTMATTTEKTAAP